MEEDEKVDLGELHNVINDFQTTLNKVKQRPNLQNYHQRYMKGLKKRAKAASEKQLIKVHQLIPPGIGTDHNFNLYGFILAKSLKKPVFLPIIETLFVFKKNPPVYIYNNALEKVVHVNGEMAFAEFYKKLLENHENPVCIYKPTDGKKRVLHDVESVKNFVLVSEGLEGSFQRFVLPINGRGFVLRLHWKLHLQMRGYLMSSLKNFSETRHMELRFQHTFKDLIENPNKNLIGYARNIMAQSSWSKPKKLSVISNDSARNQILTSEESPLATNENRVTEVVQTSDPSVIDEIHFLDETSRKSNNNTMENSFFQENNSDKYLVTGRNPKNSIVNEVKYIDDELKIVVRNFMNLLANQTSKKKTKVLEITLDFMKSKNKKWLFLKCDKVKLDENPKNYRELVIPDEKRVFSTFMSFLCPEPTKVDGQVRKIELSELVPHVDPPIIPRRHLSRIEFISRKTIISDPEKRKIMNLEEKFNKVISRLDKLAAKKFLVIEEKPVGFNEKYEKSYLEFASTLKTIKHPIKELLNDTEIKPNRSSNSFKSVIKEYDSMMIHVRRLNQKNNKPLLDIYGGEKFWKKAMAKIYTCTLESSQLNHYFCDISKEIFKSMSNGLICILNSSITINFRREVRNIHKSASISSRDFSAFRSIFISTLRDFSVSVSDLEIIQDNIESFRSAIVTKK